MHNKEKEFRSTGIQTCIINTSWSCIKSYTIIIITNNNFISIALLSYVQGAYLFSQRNVERKIGARIGAWEGG